MHKKGLDTVSLKITFRGIVVWFSLLILLTVLISAFAGKMNISEKHTAYISSALTFVSSAAAGYTVHRGKTKFLYSLILSIMLIVIALLLGFIISSGNLCSGGILSVVSFTLCGVFAGSIINPPKKKKGKIKL